MIACVFTLGCKMNEAESASFLRAFKEAGYEVTDKPAYADVYLLNTCAVTREAERKSRQAVTRLRKFNPQAPVIVCGCASQNNETEFFEKEGVTYVFGARNKGKILSLIEDKMKDVGGVFVEDENAFCELPFPEERKTRAFLRIQDGCNRFCSYCLIPYLRGRTRSRSADSVLKEAGNCPSKEIVLTGIDISSYRDGENDLADLLTRLSVLKKRVRLGSVEPGVVTERFLTAVKEAGNVAEHFHLSLQSGSTKVLKAMNRHYTREEYLQKCRLIYSFFPKAAITTDIIVGYPTEDEEDFLQSLSIVEEAGFARVHVFPFSPRKGTAAEKLKDLPASVKKERAARMEEAARLQEERYARRFLGEEVVVLFEEDGGYSSNYLRVFADGAQEGWLCRVRLKEITPCGIRGEIEQILC